MTLKLEGVQTVLNKLAKVDDDLTKSIDGVMLSASNDMVRIAKRAAPFNFGQLHNSIGQERVSNMRYTIFATAFHAPFIEFGTGPKVSVPAELQDVAQAVKTRKGQGKWKDFVNDILLWGEKKGIIKKGDKGHAYAIARKIYRNGITPQPYLYPSFLSVKPRLIRDIKDLIRGIKL